MSVSQKLRLIEWIMFSALIICICGAGFVYGLYKDRIDGVLLVGLLSVYLLIMYALYKLLLKYILKRARR